MIEPIVLIQTGITVLSACGYGMLIRLGIKIVRG